jgi:hypothetical protein
MPMLSDALEPSNYCKAIFEGLPIRPLVPHQLQLAIDSHVVNAPTYIRNQTSASAHIYIGEG